jgi:nucleoid-associated protein EbfC
MNLNPKMLKQIEEMQAKMVKAQEQLGEATVEGSAGGGAVVIVMDGHQNVRTISIDPEFIEPEDVETLQDAIVAAFHNAQSKVQELSATMMTTATGMNPMDLLGQ